LPLGGQGILQEGVRERGFGLGRPFAGLLRGAPDSGDEGNAGLADADDGREVLEDEGD
jgi:hypothetical protein